MKSMDHVRNKTIIRSKKNTKNKQKPQELCNTYQHEHKQKYDGTVGTETREDCLNQEN